MYQEMRSLHDAVSRVETKLDGMRDGYVEVRRDVADHETRIRGLEKAIWRAAGAAAVIGAGAGVAVQLLGK